MPALLLGCLIGRAAAAAQAPPSPIHNPFAQLLGKPGKANALDDKQRAIVARVNDYLSRTQLLSGKFVQIGPDGSRSTGRVLHL